CAPCQEGTEMQGGNYTEVLRTALIRTLNRMSGWNFVAAVLALVASCAACAHHPSIAPPAAPVTRQALAENLADKTGALVEPTDGLDARAYCSGVWVSPEEIVTAAHCVDDNELGDEIEYAVESGVIEIQGVEVVLSHTATLRAIDLDVDLALLL